MNTKPRQTEGTELAKGCSRGSKDVIVKHTDRKTDRESETRGPFNLRQELYSRERGYNDFDLRSYLYIV